jgi:hypothetical protein
MYFNEKRAREGALFQGTFKAKHAATDEYLEYLFAYIHLNPAALFNKDWEEATHEEVEVLFRNVTQYEYSSVGEYLNKEKQITDMSKFPEYFDTPKMRRDHLKFWHKYKAMYEGNALR